MDLPKAIEFCKQSCASMNYCTPKMVGSPVLDPAPSSVLSLVHLCATCAQLWLLVQLAPLYILVNALSGLYFLTHESLFLPKPDLAV